MIDITYWSDHPNVFGGRIVLQREFYNPKTNEEIRIEAHEDNFGEFHVGTFDRHGNNDGDTLPLSSLKGMGLVSTLVRLQTYKPPAGFVEGEQPKPKRSVGAEINKTRFEKFFNEDNEYLIFLDAESNCGKDCMQALGAALNFASCMDDHPEVQEAIWIALAKHMSILYNG